MKNLERIFKTFEEVKHFVNSIKKEEHVPLRVLTSTTVESANRKLKNPANYYPPEMMYTSILYCCKHHGKFRSRGKGIRNVQHVLPSECPYTLQFIYNRTLQGFIITKEERNHNHDIGEEIMNHYADNRRLGESEQEEALRMLAAGEKVGAVRNYMQRKTNKVVLVKDLHNLRISRTNRLRKSDLEKIFDVGKDFLNQTIGNEFIMILDNGDNHLEMLFLQTKSQKDTYEKFGAVLYLDSSYPVSKTGMPLFNFVIEDCHGHSVVIANCLITNVGNGSVAAMLEIFKSCNPALENTKVILVDKEFSDIEAIKEQLPGCGVCLCTFHMKRAIASKLKSLRVDENLKSNIQKLVKSMAKSATEDELDLHRKELENLQADFYTYFEDHWMPCKELWLASGQEGMFSLLTSTANNLDANHRNLKKNLSSSAYMSELVKILAELVTNSKTFSNHQDFREKMCTTISYSTPDEIKPYFELTTNFASQLISEEYNASRAQKYTVLYTDNAEIQVITLYNVHTCSGSLDSCSCNFFSIMGLPCRHLFLLRHMENAVMFCPTLVNVRFKKGYGIPQVPAITLDLPQDAQPMSTTTPLHQELQPVLAMALDTPQDSHPIVSILRENEKDLTHEKHSKDVASDSRKECHPKVAFTRGNEQDLTHHEKYRKSMDLMHHIGIACGELSMDDFLTTMSSLEKILSCIQNREALVVNIEPSVPSALTGFTTNVPTSSEYYTYAQLDADNSNSAVNPPFAITEVTTIASTPSSDVTNTLVASSSTQEISTPTADLQIGLTTMDVQTGESSQISLRTNADVINSESYFASSKSPQSDKKLSNVVVRHLKVNASQLDTFHSYALHDERSQKRKAVNLLENEEPEKKTMLQKAQVSKKNICGDCRKKIGKTSKSFSCVDCLKWIHWRCAGIEENPGEDAWLCCSCSWKKQ